MHRHLVLFLGLLTAAACSALGAAPSPFQLHAVVDAPGPNTKEHQLPRRSGKPETVLLDSTVLLDHRALRSARAEREENGTYRILLEFTDEGAMQFGQITKERIGKRLAIVLGGKLQSAPVVNEPITGGSAAISGKSSQEEAEALVAALKSAIEAKRQ